MELRAQAAVEQDAAKVLELVQKINELLLQKERRLGIPVSEQTARRE